MTNHPGWPEAFLDLALQVSRPGKPLSPGHSEIIAHPTSDLLTENHEIHVTSHYAAFSLSIELNPVCLPGGKATAH